MIRYQVTNGKYSKDPDAWMRTLAQDADFIQIRERDLCPRDLAALTRTVVSSVSAKVLVNDRADVAIACGAHGVHLRSRSVSPSRVKMLRHRLVVSVACHEMDDLAKIEEADYAILAPIYNPLSKPMDAEPLGLAGLRTFATMCPVPVIALGGITKENAAECIAAGASGIAGITLFE